VASARAAATASALEDTHLASQRQHCHQKVGYPDGGVRESSGRAHGGCRMRDLSCSSLSASLSKPLALLQQQGTAATAAALEETHLANKRQHRHQELITLLAQSENISGSRYGGCGTRDLSRSTLSATLSKPLALWQQQGTASTADTRIASDEIRIANQRQHRHQEAGHPVGAVRT
jgi:hypothetical protein